MFTLESQGSRRRDGLSRRELIRVGGLGLFGLTLDGLVSNTSAMPPPQSASLRPGKAKSCILLFMLGGPPQHSTWDPKPQAEAEVRGEFDAIATSVTGVQISELMPKTAVLADRLAILRAVSTNDNAHSSSGYAMMTGRPHSPLNFENANPGAPNNWPTVGAVVQHLQTERGAMPASIRLPHHIYNTDRSVWPGQDSGWLGPAADPWLFRCEPGNEEMGVPDFQLPADVPLARFSERRNLLAQLDQRLNRLETHAEFEKLTVQNKQAFNLLTSAESFRACDLSLESAPTRNRYGRHPFGQSVLMARRLVEEGVKLVQVNWYRGPDEPADAPCWDTHAREAKRLKEDLAPPFDAALSSLIEDLEHRGLLEETLVICMGEFGRTPKFNANGGRDHWGHAFSIALAGGGVKGGVVHGSTDKHAAFPIEGLVQPQDLTATLFHCLGYAPATEIRDPLGRPFPISSGNVIQEIL